MASNLAVKKLISFLEGVLGTKRPKGIEVEWPLLFAEPGIDDDELLEAGRTYVKDSEYKAFPAPGVLFKLASAATQDAAGAVVERWWEKNESCDKCNGLGMRFRDDDENARMILCACPAGDLKRAYLNEERRYGRAQNRHGE